MNPACCSRSLGLLGAGVIPGAPPVGEVALELVRGGDLIGEYPERVDVPAASALGHELAAGLDRGVQAREQAVVIVDPVKRRVGERCVDRLGKLELDEVLAQDRRSVAERLLRVLGHRRRHVDPVHAAVRHPVGQQCGHPARAAAGVEHDIVVLQLEAVELLERPSQLDVRDAVIRRRVPVARGAHSAVVTGPERSRSRS